MILLALAAHAAPLCAGPSVAARPDAGDELYGYADEDVLATWDVPRTPVRVTYSVSGPNAVADPDESPPALVAEAGRVAAESLARFAEVGLHAPTHEADVGLPDLGGNASLDVYLVDFGGAADGRFVIDGCTAGMPPCAGHLVVENDFRGYGYASTTAAVETVVSHELFHAVQATYAANLPIWVSEGTAVWAERLYDPDNTDFLRFADAYLAEPRRSLDRPPPGPVPAFAYGTGLWWDHLTRRHDDGLIHDLLLAFADPEADPLAAMNTTLGGYGDDLVTAWPTFALANLHTGERAGPDAPHPHADQLAGIEPDTRGAELTVDLRVYPLSTRYDRLRPAPSQLAVRYSEPDADVTLLVVPEAADGLLGPPIYDGPTTDVPDTIEVDAAAVWLITAHGGQTDVLKGSLCASEAGGPCAPEVVEDEPKRGCATTDRASAGTLVTLLALLPIRRRPLTR